MHGVATSPHPVALVGRSGVEAWDRVSNQLQVYTTHCRIEGTCPHPVALVGRSRGGGVGQSGYI